MAGRLAALVRKELSQLLRDVPMLLILLWAFTGAVYTGGHGMSTELNEYPIAVLDLSRSPESRELVGRFRAPYFRRVPIDGDDELVAALDGGRVSLAVVVPPDFARRLRDGGARFQVIVDGSQATLATIAAAHIARIAGDYGAEVAGMAGAGPQVDTRIRIEYNPNLDEAWFSTVLELLSQVSLIAMLLAAAAMVREREQGTIESLLVSPLRPLELFAAKVVPVVALVPLAALASLFAIVQGAFGTPLRGSVALFYAVSVVYVFAMASLGLAVAVVARNLGQAVLLLLLVFYPMMLLSGAFTPPESLAAPIRYAMLLSPVRHYIEFGYQVLFKGNGLADVWPHVAAMLGLGAAIFWFSVRRFERLLR